jgi:DNA invertase Pin-like site-specific DNA recombinase
MVVFAEFERSMMRRRQREGFALAKQRVSNAGRRRVLSLGRAVGMVREAAAGSRSPGRAGCGFCRETVYRYLGSGQAIAGPGPTDGPGQPA